MSLVGFEHLQNTKVTRRAIQGITFNLMFAGLSGVGKTTLINSLFNIDYDDSPNDEDERLSIKEYFPNNKTMRIKLTIIETKNLSGQSPIYKPIVDYIDASNENYFRNELDAKTRVIPDNRVHCCIYMIGHNKNGADPRDILTMKELQHRVCLVPIITRVDQLTLNQLESIRRTIVGQIIENDIEMYSPGQFELPFSVAASDEIINENGKVQRIRSFRFGRANIEEISDFLLLRDLILKSHMFSLIDCTARVHYENYREDAIREIRERCHQSKDFDSRKTESVHFNVRNLR